MSGALFKKEINERSRTLLKNKDSRAFKQILIDQFRGVDSDSLGEIFATRSQQVYVGKIGCGTKDLLYSSGDSEPLAVDLNSKNELLPTLYFMSKFPMALRQFIIHSPVSEYVLKGADLMMPGVCTSEGLEGIVLNEMVSIRVKGNPIPFAVGLSLVSWEGIQSNGMRGRAVRVLHYFGDMLCYKWNRNAPINDGFSLSRIGALSGYVEPMGYVDEVEAGLKIGDIGLADDMEADADAPADSIDTKIQPIKDEIHDIALHNLHPDNRLPADECVMSAADTIGGPLDSPSISDTEMDLALEICMLRALYYVVKDKHLPMLVSSLWSVSLRCALEDECKVDIKKSSAKKVSVFLQQYATLGDGEEGLPLLQVSTEDNGVSYVVGVNRSHRMFKCPTGNTEGDASCVYANRSAIAMAAIERMQSCEESDYFSLAATVMLFRRIVEHGYRVPEPEEFRSRLRHLVEADTESTNSSAMLAQGLAGEHTRSTRGKQGALKVVDLYRPSRPFRDMLGRIEGEFGECLTAAEVRTIMLSYLTEREFPVTDGGASVEIPTDDPLYKHIQLAKYNAARKSSASISSALPPPASKDVWADHVDYNSDDDGCSHENVGNAVAGVYLPSVSDFIQLSSAPLMPKPSGVDKLFTSAVGNFDKLSTRELLSEKGTGKPVELPSTVHKVAKIQKSSAVSKTPKDVACGTDKCSDGKNNQHSHKLPTTPIAQEPVVIQKKEVVKETLIRFSSYYVVISGNGEFHVSSGSIPNVQIDVEKRSGNKMVTKLSGMNAFGIEGNSLVRDCQKKFACSASYSASATRANTMEVSIQGLVVDELLQLLVENYGLPKTVINVNMGKGIKPKKK